MSRRVCIARAGDKTSVSRHSPRDGKLNTVTVDAPYEDVRDFYFGQPPKSALNMFPKLSAMEREFLETGITEKDWRLTFSQGENGDPVESSAVQEVR